MIRVLIADDHPVVRAGIEWVVNGGKDMTVVAQCSDGAEVVTLAGAEKFDVLLLDLMMPRMTGLEVIQELRRTGNMTPILILSVQPEDQFGMRSIRMGGNGYLHKDSDPNNIREAIRTVYKGGTYVSANLAQQMASELRSGERPKLGHALLSPREFQILQLLGSGRTVTQIGKDLSISKKTVSTHRTHVLEKLNLSTTADLIRYAMENKLVE